MVGDKPLTGVRVADFTWVWAGPFCTQQLAHLGADVIRVETPERLCPTRLMPPFADSQPGFNRSGFFNQYNSGKRSLTLDLKQPRGLEAAKRLIENSDVVAESFGAGVIDRFGLSYDQIRQIRPDIIMVSISGYGRTGPESDRISYGPAIAPLSGLSALTGFEGAPPHNPGFSYGDPVGGLHAAFAVLAALYYRARTGVGQFIDVSLWETTSSLVPEALLDYDMNGVEPSRCGNRVQVMAPHGVFPCSGVDKWVSIAVATDAEWQRLAWIIDDGGLATDHRFTHLDGRKRHEDELDERISQWTRERSREDVTSTLQHLGIAAFPTMTSRDLDEDTHLNARGFFVDVPHPEVGRRRHAGIPWKLSGTPCEVTRAAPCLGEHSLEVLGEVLGYSDAEIAELASAGALGELRL